MISIDTEEKILKTLGLGLLFSMPLFSLVIKADELKLMILIPLLILMSVLFVRKFIRDRNEGQSLKKYYIAFGFILVSIAMFLFELYRI